MVKEKCGPAVKECTVEQGLGGSGPGAAAPYRVIARITRGLHGRLPEVRGAERPDLRRRRAELHKHRPVIQINEVVM